MRARSLRFDHFPALPALHFARQAADRVPRLLSLVTHHDSTGRLEPPLPPRFNRSLKLSQPVADAWFQRGKPVLLVGIIFSKLEEVFQMRVDAKLGAPERVEIAFLPGEDVAELAALRILELGA